MTVLHEAHRQNPDDFWLNDALGWLSVDACRPPRYEDALRYYMATVVLRPRNATAHRAVAELLEKKGTREEAIAEYSRALELDPQDRRARRERADAYLNDHQYEKAADDYSKAIDLEPKRASTWNARGHAYLQIGQFEKTIADCSKAIELDPKSPVFLHNRAWGYWGVHQNTKALADFAKAIELNPKYVEVFYDRGLVYHGLGQYDKACADWSRALELEPKSHSYQNQLAWLMATCPDAKVLNPMLAVELAGKAVKTTPNDGNLWNTLGVAQYRAGYWKPAIASLTRSMELLGDHLESFNTFFLAMAHWQIGEKEKASKWYNRAVQWMEKSRQDLEKNAEQRTDLNRFRAEAEALLGVRDK